MSVAANIIGMGLHDLPAMVTAQLQNIGKMDKITKNLTIQLSKEENQLLETLKSVAKYDPTFNEEPLKEAAANISKRRFIVSQMIEKQTKSLQSIYDHLDKKISYFENILKHHAPHLHSEFSSNGNSQVSKNPIKCIHVNVLKYLFIYVFIVESATQAKEEESSGR